MKRDMDLVRELLLLIEESEFGKNLVIPDNWDRKVVAYHLKILDQAGYVENNTHWGGDKPLWFFASLTWDGHEFLDSIKNDNIWNKTKEGIKKKGFEIGSIPVDVLKEYAKLQLKILFGLD